MAEEFEKCSLCSHPRRDHAIDKNGYNHCKNCDCHGFKGYNKGTELLDGNLSM
ncbi:hypothetical protein BH18THE1_BH18THE1_16440 [soil metagenome]